jgi:hypothetical protein
MLRLLLWLVLAWIVWKVVQSLTGTPKDQAGSRHDSPPPSPKPPFRDIEDATFEDLTPDKDGKQ